MPKKKQAPNAFLFFMLHFREEERKKGRHLSMAQVQKDASEPWKAMDAQKRGPFEKQAKEAKNGPKKEVEKYTSQGIPLSLIEKEKLKMEQEVRDMKETIKKIVENGFINNTIGSQEFFFISGVYFVNVNDNYLPAELAMVKFSFENGIENKFHTYVNPEKVPMGYLADCKEYSQISHQLPIPPLAKGEKKFSNILREMKNFLGQSERPLLFTVKEHIPMIKSFVQTFIDFVKYDGDDDDIDRYRIYPLHELFFNIKEEAVKTSVAGKSFRSIFIAEEHLKRDDYTYLTDTACAYHEEKDCAKYCALAHVQKWAYIFADHICMDLNIQPVSGKHFPIDIDVNAYNNSVSNVDNTTNTTITEQQQSHNNSNVAAPSWGVRPRSPVPSRTVEDFPSLGSHNRRGGGRFNNIRSVQRDVNNPWNTSSSSSDSNPFSQNRHDSDDTSFRADMNSSYSRGMGRGSALFRDESGFGRRGRAFNDESPRRHQSSNHFRSKRSHHQKSEYDDSDSKRRRY